MTRNKSLLISALLVTAGIMVLVSGCTTARNQPGVTVSPTATFPPTTVVSPVVTVPVPAQSCSVDDDCIPAQCCHPSSCISKAEKRVCNVMCTMSCEGPIDCGAGRCGCVSGSCGVIPSTLPT